MQKITVTLWNQEQEPVVHKTFVGTWVISPDEEWGASTEDVENNLANNYCCFAVAETQKGALAVYAFTRSEGYQPSFDVYEDVEAMEGGIPPSVIAEVAARQGVDYEVELDI